MEKIDAIRAFSLAAQASTWACGHTQAFTPDELLLVKDFSATLAKNCASALAAAGYVSPRALKLRAGRERLRRQYPLDLYA